MHSARGKSCSFRITGRFLCVALPLLLILCGCGTSRVYRYPYGVVAGVLKDKFVKHQDDMSAEKPDVSESDGAFDISLMSNLDYYFGIGTDISLERKTPDTSEVTVTVTEYYKSWSYRSRNMDMEKEFLDILEKRLKTGKWDRLPWQKKKEICKDILPAVFRNFGK